MTPLCELKAAQLEQVSLEYYDEAAYCNDSRAFAKIESKQLRVLCNIFIMTSIAELIQNIAKWILLCTGEKNNN